jgi:hypothetical protein
VLLKSPSRVAAVAACLLIAVAVLAGTSAGSPPGSPRATAPRLLVHDTSGFGVSRRPAAKRHSANHGPKLLRAPRKALGKKRPAPARALLDSLTDTNIANTSSDIGISQFLVASNGFYDVLSRTSGIPLLAAVSNTSFWAGLTVPGSSDLCATNPQGQPSVAYDQAADRWVISEAAYAGAEAGTPTGAFVECVAVSTSPDATGTWNRYVFQVSTTLYPERPTLGVWSDGYYLSFNQHTATDVWAGAGALALERSKMLTGAAAQARYFDLENVTPGLGGMLPADMRGANAPTPNAPEPYLQAHDDPNNLNDRLEVWGFHVDWTAPVTGSTFQPIVNLPLNTGGFSINTSFGCVPPGSSTVVTACLNQLPPGSQVSTTALEPLAQAHADSADKLPQLGGRLQWSRSAGGNETLTAAATVNMGSNEARPAWFELSNVGGGGWNIGAKGVYNPGDALSRFLPSVAVDGSGEVGLAFVKTGAAINPTDSYTNASDGAFGEVDLVAGSEAFTVSSNFGRYTSLSVDPVDNCTFWFSGPLPDNSGSTIAINDFSFPTCVASGTQPPLLTGDPSLTAPLVREGLTINGHDATFSNATSTTYQWRLCDSRGLNCVDIAGATGPNHVATAADAAGDRTFRFEEIATNANGSSEAVSRPSTIVQSIPPFNLSLPVLSGAAQSGVQLSTTDGTWRSSSPVSYTYRWRRCTSGVCANIGGANSSTYTLTDNDIGSTIDVVVSATNTGGGTDANASATVPVVAAAPVAGGGGSSGGSGGGGGGAGAPDLQVSGFVSSLSPMVGDGVMFSLTVFDANSVLAQSLVLTLSLPSGLQYVSSSADRGSGCKASSAAQVVCTLDFLGGVAPRGNVQIYANVVAAGSQVVTATATSQQGVLTAAHSTASVTLNARTVTTATSTGTPSGLNGGVTTTKKTADKVKPSSRAIASSGKRGRTAKLRFRIYDDRGVAKALATIKRHGKVVATAKTGFGPVAYGSTYYVGWHVPAKAPMGGYSFCVVAVDRAGNASRASCSPLAVK